MKRLTPIAHGLAHLWLEGVCLVLVGVTAGLLVCWWGMA